MILLKDTSIFDFYTAQLRENVHIVIEGNKITRLISKESSPHEFENYLKGNYSGKAPDKIIECRDKIVTTGFTNAHSHTAMTLLRGAAEDVNSFDWFNKHIWIYEKNLTPDYVYYGTLLGATEMLLSGVTFVCDHYFYMDRAAEAYMKAGIRADLAWAVFGQGEHWERDFKNAMDFTEKYRDKEETITVSLGPHSPYICPKDFLEEIAKVSEDTGIKTHIHVSEEKWQIEKSLKETGKTPVKYLYDIGIIRKNSILAHAYHATGEDLEIIKNSGALVAHAPKTYMKFGFMMPFLPHALKTDIRLSFASDGPTSNNTLSIMEAARDAALLAKLSVNNAEVARIEQLLPLLSNAYTLLDKKLGKVEKDYIADLVIIDRNNPAMFPEINIGANILYSLNDRAIDTVLVNGKIVVENGKLLTVDIEELRTKINKISQSMVNPSKKTQKERPMQEFGK